MAANIKRIEDNVVFDNTSCTGRRIIGFDSFYENSRFDHSCVLFSQYGRDLVFYTTDGCAKTVRIDERIEAIDIYHAQYGIPVEDARNCFFITSWYKGIYCCSLDTGKVLWNYKLKHATKVFLYEDYLVCAFQEIGLRKLSYDGKEIAKYPFVSYDACFRLNDTYLLCGPKRGMYYILDSRTMDIHKKIKGSVLFANSDPNCGSQILLEAQGRCEDFMICGFENDQRFERRIQL